MIDDELNELLPTAVAYPPPPPPPKLPPIRIIREGDTSVPSIFDADPDSWSFDRYRAVHLPSGMEFCTYMGFSYFSPGSTDFPLGFWLRWKLWRHIKQLRKANFLSALAPQKDGTRL